MPQLFVWQKYNLTKNFSQCTTIWGIKRRENLTDSYAQLEKVYSIGHALTVFWLPAFGIAVCYGIVFHKLVQRQKRQHLRKSAGAAFEEQMM